MSGAEISSAPVEIVLDFDKDSMIETVTGVEETEYFSHKPQPTQTTMGMCSFHSVLDLG